MKRLGIFCFYDKDGIVDDCIQYLLEDLRKVVQELYIVINGHVKNTCIEILDRYAEQVITRDNVGFDIGAYADVLLNSIGEKEITKWDEVILCNDTFYGPFESFSVIFEKMESQKCDFWGLNEVRGELFGHIQSYFLVFRKSIIMSGELLIYLKKHIDLEKIEIQDVYAIFEVGLFSYLKGKCFESKVYKYTENYDIYRNQAVCMKEYGLPILKKKCFSPEYRDWDEMKLCLNYINCSTTYNIDYILQNIKRIYDIQIDKKDILLQEYNKKEEKRKRVTLPDVDFEEVKSYISSCDEVYIYGTGVLARKIWFFYHEFIKRFGGFIVSDGQKNTHSHLYGFPVRSYSSCKSSIDVLIALNKDNTETVMKKKKRNDRFFYLWKEWNDIC